MALTRPSPWASTAGGLGHPVGIAARRPEIEGFCGKGMDQVAGQGLGRAACRRALCR